ncbi:efflux RND transporter permease subunit [Ancrocorticia populi]|uniref:AcrB/AcrD/AcrF family protein n=1 Tax=Ancrocorticia populi TaxID=2175228 RepID=A0A2V1K933_9ACTO|nr:efflux RND transporter permease subunit [Ancrocorticia populi]PWF26985.1 AcrB/AcrD/AcrF family protein [Ancrocorticia populi]
MDRLARASLRNRSFVALVCIVAAILGGISMSSMRQELIPQVELPAVSVVAVSPGATAEQVNERVAGPIEQQMATIPEVKEASTNSSSSYGMITIELEYGTDLSRATSKVEQSISQIEDSFPDDTTTQVTSGGSSDIPLSMVGVTSDDDALQTAQNVRGSVIPHLEKIDGVASAQLIGAPEQRVTISLNMEKAAAAGVSADAIQDALDDNGLSVPAGTVAGDDHTLDVTIGQDIDSLDGLKEIPLLATDPLTGEDTSVELGEVAKVDLTGETSDLMARIDGKPAVAMIIFPTANANIVETSGEVNDALADLTDMAGEGAAFTTIFDQAPFITTSIQALAQEGGLGLIMAVAVILIFLVAVRPTLVTAVSIPLSLLLAFIFMNVAGYSLNMLTLSALIITIGRVVDDSIVVIENIKRHLEYGDPKRQAIQTAVKEVASAVTASTIVTCLVFIPVGFISGMVGELFKPFAFTVVLAMASSLFVSLTIVPVLAYWFLRPSKAARASEDAVRAAHATTEVVEGRSVSEARERAERLLAEQRAAAEAKEEKSWLRRIYRPALRGTQKHPVITFVVAVAILAGSGALYPMLKVNLLGDTGQNMVMLSQEAPAGTDMESLTDRAAVAEEALGNVAGVESVATTIGGAGMGQSAASISYVVTTDEDADQELLTQKLEDALAENSSGDQTGSSEMEGITSTNVDVNIVANNEQTLQEANDQLFEALQDTPGAKQVTTNLSAEQPSVKVTVNREAAAAAGLSENDIVGLIASQIVSPSIGQITLDNIDTDIYVKLADPVSSLDDLENMEIMGQPISAFATVEEVDVVPSVVTINGQQTATISLTPEDSDELGALRDNVAETVDSTDLPTGATTTEAGAAQQLDDVFNQLGLAMAAAILLMYVVLVWIFKSLSQPLILLVSIPFAAIGAFLAMLMTSTPLGVSSLIGLLMLTGIVVTNAIVLIDLINQYRRQGMSMDEAIDLGAQRRMRPIIMTAVATIAALVPMALGITGHAGFISQPLAVTVIGGLISSTLLTLVLLPVLYRLTQKNAIKAEDLEEIPVVPSGQPAEESAEEQAAEPAAETAQSPSKKHRSRRRRWFGRN